MPIEAAAGVISDEYFRHYLALDAESEGRGGGGGDSAGAGASVTQKMKRYLLGKDYSRAVGAPVAA